MKNYLMSALLFLALAWSASAGELVWKTDLDAAKSQAKAEKKMVLVNFTGSDWCGWCKKLKAEVFDKKEFVEYAEKNLVLVELDYPVKKQQSPELKQANAKLKDKYEVQGFPTLLALNSQGEQVWKQTGYLAGGPSVFIGKLQEAQKK